MPWYGYTILIILLLILIFFITCYISYRMTFYSKNKKYPITDDIYLPDDPIFNEFRCEIIEDIKTVRGYTKEEYIIKSHDGLYLSGKYYEYKKGAPLEIMFHGYRGNSERDMSTGVLRAFKCERNALIVDHRASGNSTGHTITFGIKERLDCLSWLNFAIEKFGEDTQIILTGISMGAATVLLTSDEDLPKNVKGILADCGYTSPKEIIKKVVKDMKLPVKLFYPIIKFSARLFGKFNLEEKTPLEAVKNAKVPIFFVHGDKDGFVPTSMSKEMYDACTSKKTLVLIKDALHGTSYMKDSTTYIDELNKFFK